MPNPTRPSHGPRRRPLSRRPESPGHRWAHLAFDRARPRSRGQAIVELAVILPVLLVLLAAGADLARIFHSQVAIESAARAGALEASRPPDLVPGRCCPATRRPTG